MKVELLDHMGSDLDVVNAARVSFDKESEYECHCHKPNGVPTVCTYHKKDQCGSLSDKDAKLIRYLATHGHWTPFSHCYAKFRIKAPLFVRSQLFKHKVGLTENEVSRRYVDSEPEFYVPEKWRKRAENKKQGSSDEVVGLTIPGFPRAAMNEALTAYKYLLEDGVCPEQARMVLPQSMMTEWIWSGSLSAFARVYKQRTSDHAQWETKQVALQIGEALEPLFPVSWAALTEVSE